MKSISLFFSIIVLVVSLLPIRSFASHIDLKPCIQTSHCVREELVTENIKDPLSEIQIILENTPRMEIVEIDGDYLHAESTSRIMKYVDDLEVSFDESNNKLIIRSESRVGEGDFGVNQKRVDLLKSELFKSKV
tara:strand:- start:129 stop:530 length:402 start_codon:yes stop_codon:yes gene_type:complete